MFQVTTVIYALEISPLCLRPYLTNYVNFCWVSYGYQNLVYRHSMVAGEGKLTRYIQVIWQDYWRGGRSRNLEYGKRVGLPDPIRYSVSPFFLSASLKVEVPANVSRWVWPAMLIPLIYFAPESPWWLVRQGSPTAARNVVQKLISGTDPNFDIDKNVTLMIVTTEHERTINSETSYRACFQSANLRRTLIVVGIYCIQVLNGNSLRGYSTYFLQQAGLPTTQAFNMTIANLAVAIVGSFCSVYTPSQLPRIRISLIFMTVGIFTAFWTSNVLFLEPSPYVRHNDAHWRSWNPFDASETDICMGRRIASTYLLIRIFELHWSAHKHTVLGNTLVLAPKQVNCTSSLDLRCGYHCGGRLHTLPIESYCMELVC